MTNQNRYEITYNELTSKANKKNLLIGIPAGISLLFFLSSFQIDGLNFKLNAINCCMSETWLLCLV